IFTSAFLIIQAVMVLVSILSTGGANQGEDLAEFGGLFWSIFGFALLVALPLRGFSALTNEVQNGSLETIFLTRLSAWRIVYGKWLGLFSQTVLICLSIIPYVILRYFLGNINLSDELIQFVTLLLLSGLITAIVVGLSSQRTVFIRLVMIGVPIYISSIF